jgi:hypothetical protein
MKHDTMLNFARNVHLQDGKPVRGYFPNSSTELSLDLVNKEIRAHRFVQSWVADGPTKTVRLQGGARQIRDELNGQMGAALNLTPEDIERVMSSAVSMRDPDDMFTFTLTHDLALGNRLAAKVALGAGVLADPAFARSPLAAGLRCVMNNECEVDRTVDPGVLEALVDIINNTPPGANPVSPLEPGQGEHVSCVVFARMRNDETAVFSYVLGMLVSISGIVVEAPLGLDDFGCVVTDGSPTVVRRLMYEALTRLASLNLSTD